MVSLHEVHSGIGIVSAVVSTIAGGISIAKWFAKKPAPDSFDIMLLDLAILEQSEFDGWIEHDVFTAEHGGGYAIYVYLDGDEVDRVQIREPGKWRAEGVAELLRKTGIDLGLHAIAGQ